jgi:hypothetical protein
MKVKVCFMIDATQSMTAWIDAAKTQTKTIVDSIMTETPNISLEIGAVFYRDFGDSQMFEIVPFTASVEDFLGRIKNVRAVGGNDICENVAGGFEEMLALDWSGAEVKNAFLICDAPPHGREWHTIFDGDRFPDNDGDLTQLLHDMNAKGIKLSVIRANKSVDPMIAKMSLVCPDIVVLDMESQAPPLPPPTYDWGGEGSLPPPTFGLTESGSLVRYPLPSPGDPTSPNLRTLSRHVSNFVVDSINASQYRVE